MRYKTSNVEKITAFQCGACGKIFKQKNHLTSHITQTLDSSTNISNLPYEMVALRKPLREFIDKCEKDPHWEMFGREYFERKSPEIFKSMNDILEKGKGINLEGSRKRLHENIRLRLIDYTNADSYIRHYWNSK